MLSSTRMPILAGLLLSLAVSQSTAQFRGSNVDPCRPSPCGPNTECSVNADGAAICRCITGYFPKPDTITGCGPQCEQDYECRSHEKCHANQCLVACGPGTCGINAECEGTNHRAVCKCPRGYTGDPLFQCTQERPIARAIISQPPPQAIAIRVTDPCSPNPCGVNAECRVSLDRPVCSCLPGHQGNPHIRCNRGECSSNSECPSFKVCENYQCVNPCSKACGTNAQCDVRNHVPTCSCPPGYTGSPTTHCRVYNPNELCEPSPCGQNTKCRVENNRAICTCRETYQGDPLSGCRHECESDSQCASSQTCKNFRCSNPCVNACGTYASCEVINHRAVCKCPTDYLGDPYTKCFPECTSHSDCPGNLACIGLKCGNPCEKACGINADCRVDRASHKAICSCPKGYTGHPFTECRRQTPADLCSPNPCGESAVCNPGHDNSGRDRPVCTCPAGYIGDALVRCRRGECASDSECPFNRICSNFNCVDPCRDACGVNAECNVTNRAAVCRCPSGYRGDPFRQCYLETIRAKRKTDDSSSTVEESPKLEDKPEQDKEAEVPEKTEE